MYSFDIYFNKQSNSGNILAVAKHVIGVLISQALSQSWFSF